MKITFCEARREDFTVAIALKFENGLVLRSKELLWLDAKERSEILMEMQEVIDSLREKGFEIVNDESLAKLIRKVKT